MSSLILIGADHNIPIGAILTLTATINNKVLVVDFTHDTIEVTPYLELPIREDVIRAASQPYYRSFEKKFNKRNKR